MVTAKKRVKVKDDEDGVMVKSNSDKVTSKKRVKVKGDEGVDGVDEDGVTIASDGYTLTEGDENYECAGCWRCSAVHFSYTVPQGQLEFQYATKAASFCRDCQIGAVPYSAFAALAQCTVLHERALSCTCVSIARSMLPMPALSGGCCFGGGGGFAASSFARSASSAASFSARLR